ncbi:MAG: SGNH/GDSL hydrolase family protein [Prolixibacteraceae bacterium]|jgi:lysophospholipase L1-like esterase|nr:SGNH/GDSL hydrolase family protein [Prolixibacteraceae bacterium]
MNLKSRRKFLKSAALTGIAVCCIPARETFAGIKSNTKPVRLKDNAVFLFQGDSITDGNRGRNEDLNHIMGHGYAFSIASRVGADYPEKQYQFYNKGISANKIIDLEARWQTDTIDLNPDVLSILIGVNDSASIIDNWIPMVTLKKFEETYNQLLAKTREEFPEILFVLGEPFIALGSRTIDNWEAYQVDIKQRQKVVRKLAEKYNAVFVGFQTIFDAAFEKAPVEYWIWDGVHPTVAGHELMAREWIRSFEDRISF